MAYELVEEVLDHAPAGLTPAERLILVCIAEEARKATRTAEIPVERLRRRTGLGENGLRPAMRRLTARGIDFRIPLSKDRNGKPVYAIPGRVCAYVIPVFEPPIGCECHRCEKAVSQHLHQAEEVSQHSQAVSEHRQAVPQHRQPGATAPPNQTGDPYGVSPVHAPPSPPAPEGAVDVAAELAAARAKLTAASQKHRQFANRRDGRALDNLRAAVAHMPGLAPPPAPAL